MWKPRRNPPVKSGETPREPRWALGFVVGTLILLTIVPTAIGSQARARRSELRTLTDDARGLVTEAHVQSAFARSALRNYLATQDSSYLRHYRAAWMREKATYRALRQPAQRLGGALRSQLISVEAQSLAWHARVADLLPQGASVVSSALAQDDRYEAALLGAALLDRAIATQARERNRAIAASERWARLTRYFLVVVGLAATFVLMRLGRRIRAFANEAEHGRLELSRLTEEKARMMRGLAHDVKNPLFAIHGYAEVLENGLKGNVNAEQKRCLRRIEHSVESAVRIIDTLLDLARLEAGQLEFRRIPTRLDRLVDEVSEQYRGGFENKAVNLEIEIQEPLPVILIDPDRVGEIVGNLLSNALKYTPASGRVAVRVQKVDQNTDGTSRSYVAIEVEDNGPGISAEYLEAIFDEFTRVSNGSHAPGAGLGLTISRRMAREMGGELSVRSEPGAGSTFILFLPLAGGSEQTAVASSSSTQPGANLDQGASAFGSSGRE